LYRTSTYLSCQEAVFKLVEVTLRGGDNQLNPLVLEQLSEKLGVQASRRDETGERLIDLFQPVVYFSLIVSLR
jgi:hypothetical protein